MTENAKNLCPVCQSGDSIQRLAAIVASGTASGTFSGPTGGVTHAGGETGTYGGYTTLSGTSTSHLARALSLPAEPKCPVVYSPGNAIFIGLLTLVGGLATLGLGFVAAFLALMVVASMGPILVGDPNKEFAKYAKKLAEWKLAREYWLSLYYCHRDGVVFDPVRGEQCQPEETAAFAYRHIREVPLTAFQDVYQKIKRSMARAKLVGALTQIVDEYVAGIPRGQ